MSPYRLRIVLSWIALLAATIGAASPRQAVKVDLHPISGSGISGMATLTPHGTDLIVTIVVSGTKSGAHYAHFHRGTCEHVESASMYVLEPVRDGRSTTRLKDIGLQKLIQGTYSVLIHASSSPASRHVACGTISGA